MGELGAARLSALLTGRSGPAACESLLRRHDVTGRDHSQRIDPAAVRAHHAELEAIDARHLAAPRQAAELLHEQPRHGVKPLLLGEMGAEVLVELLDAGHAAHGELALGFLAN